MNPLVSAGWVAERLHAPGLVLLDATLPPVGVKPPVDTHAHYLAEHLPGAVFFDIEALSDDRTALPHMLPTPERFARDMAALGVSHDATIVVYEQGDVFSAPRAWWMLRTLGAKDVRILDGGLRAWTDAGLPTEAGPVQRPFAVFRADLDTSAVQDFAQVQTLLAGQGQMGQGQILDARSAGRFAGTAPEPRPGLSSGHMPGAVSMPYTDLIDGARMRSRVELLADLAQKQVALQQPITTTCGSGVTAAVIALALEVCGAMRVSVYDGSWAEYAQHPEAVIEGYGRLRTE